MRKRIFTVVLAGALMLGVSGIGFSQTPDTTDVVSTPAAAPPVEPAPQPRPIEVNVQNDVPAAPVLDVNMTVPAAPVPDVNITVDQPAATETSHTNTSSSSETTNTKVIDNTPVADNSGMNLLYGGLILLFLIIVIVAVLSSGRTTKSTTSVSRVSK